MELRGRAVLHEIAAQGDEVIQNPILFVSSLIFAKNFSNRIPAIGWKNTTTMGDPIERRRGDGRGRREAYLGRFDHTKFL